MACKVDYELIKELKKYIVLTNDEVTELIHHLIDVYEYYSSYTSEYLFKVIEVELRETLEWFEENTRIKKIVEKGEDREYYTLEYIFFGEEDDEENS